MLVEASACGLAVIGSNSGEIPHVIGDAGLVVGEADQPGWAAALAEVLENPPRRQELGRRARQRAETTFAWPIGRCSLGQSSFQSRKVVQKAATAAFS